jgi:dipeptidyl aminopeptidase/acylaminoacyl peptidase
MNRWSFLGVLLMLGGPVIVAGRSTSPSASSAAPMYRNFGSSGYLSLSADGRWLAYCVNRTLQVTDVTTGVTRAVTDGRNEPFWPRWSPDAARLAFYVETDGRKELRVWERETGQGRAFPKIDVFTINAPQPPQWSPDGRRLFVIAFRAGLAPGISEKQPETSPASPPAHSTEATPPPKEPLVRVYTTSRPKPRAAKTEAASTHAEPASTVDPEQTRWSGPRETVVADVETGQVAHLFYGNGLSALALSPDGKRLAVMGNMRREASDQYVNDLYVLPVPSWQELVAQNAAAAPRPGESATDAAGHTLTPVAQRVREEGGLNMSWSPDSTQLAFGTHGLLASGDVFVVDAATGKVRNLTEKLPVPPGPKSYRTRFYEYDTSPSPKFYSAICPPLWTRDGQALLCIGQGDLWRLSVRGRGTARNLTRGFPRPIDHLLHSVGGYNPLYSADGAAVFALIRNPRQRRYGFCRINLSTGAAVILREEPRRVGDVENEGHSGEDVALQTSRVVYTMESAMLPPEAWLSDTTFRAPRPVTRINPPWDAALLGRFQVLRWKTLQGRTAEGLLVLPPGASRSHKVPMIVSVRGGVTGNADVILRFQGAAHREPRVQGYAFLHPDIPMGFGNPAQEIVGSVLPALDAAIATGVIDGERLGVCGHSYGGYTVNVLITHTNRFKAAVSSAGPADWIGMYLCKYGLDANRLSGTLWQSRQQFIENSPVFHLDRVTTPVLLVHGTADTDVPIEQSWEMFQGLKRLGKEAVLVEYAGAGHIIEDTPERAQDFQRRFYDWFDKYLKREERPAPGAVSHKPRVVEQGDPGGWERPGRTFARSQAPLGGPTR